MLFLEQKHLKQVEHFVTLMNVETNQHLVQMKHVLNASNATNASNALNISFKSQVV